MAFRLAGDEFTVILDRLEGESEAALVAGKIVEQLSRPFDLGTATVTVGSSVGVVMIPAHGSDPETLIKRADQAMYAVKAAGRNAFRLWKEGMGAGASREIPDFERDLKRAIANDEFVLHYLPTIELSSGRLVGAEALIRWQRGEPLLQAAEFMPQAEEAGLTLAMGEWVLDNACRQARLWKDQGLANLGVSVNLSAWQLSRQPLLDLVDAALDLYALPPSLLQFEISERVAMKNPGFTSSILEGLAARGVGAALDDFGLGFSSLEHLKLFPLRTLKIDQVFVRACGKGAKDEAIVRAIISLAHSLGVAALAEGVTTREQARFLKAEGCDLAQGYFFSHPVGGEEIPALAAKNHLS
jgi:EAL domain-containing protein (putative c-di-GMP-specific phosphodiesterase class I)